MSQEDERLEWSELWATFSVKDHTRPGAFIAEVLLYDKLVIPVVPTQADGLSADEAKKEWDRWKTASWDPARQTQVCALLKDRVETIPWTAERQIEWRQAMAGGFLAARDNGYFQSGSVLQRFAPALARTVVAVSQYTKLVDLERESGIRRRREPLASLPDSALLAVLGFEFLVPEEPDQDDFRFLEEAVEVASEIGYREARRDLFSWQKKFVRAEQTDALSIRRAIEEMKDLVLALRKATRKERTWNRARRFFSFLGASSKGMALIPHAALAASAGGAIAALGSFVTDANTASGPNRLGLPAATLIASAQERLGIE